MAIVRYNPFQDVQNLSRTLDRFWGNSWGVSEASMDLYEEDGHLIAEVALPNFKKDEIDVTTDEGFLEVSAKHHEEKQEKDKRHYYFQESASQYFRRVELPEGAQSHKISANFADGILKVSMPMAVKQSMKKVLVQ